MITAKGGRGVPSIAMRKSLHFRSMFLAAFVLANRFEAYDFSIIMWKMFNHL